MWRLFSHLYNKIMYKVNVDVELRATWKIINESLLTMMWRKLNKLKGEMKQLNKESFRVSRIELQNKG